MTSCWYQWPSLPAILALALTAPLTRSTDGFSLSLVRKRHESSLRNVVLHHGGQASSSMDASAEELPVFLRALKGCVFHEFQLYDHKPLGCSVEESLAEEPDGAKYVFVAQVNEGGNAEKIGIEVGDVIVRLSGTFDELLDVAGLGLERVQSLVVGRLAEQALTICIARGSDVMARHEVALVDLCILGDDVTTSSCISKIFEYSTGDSDDISDKNDSTTEVEDDNIECMINSLWGACIDDETLPLINNEDKQYGDTNISKKKIAPWSSRSSPSGTYVRDPSTGKMINIDE